MKVTPSRMDPWKSEVGSGWHHLLDLANKIVPQSAKFSVARLHGGLRITILSKPSDRVLQELFDLEKISYNTCEECGDWHNVTTNKVGEMHTLCGECRESA